MKPLFVPKDIIINTLSIESLESSLSEKEKILKNLYQKKQRNKNFLLGRIAAHRALAMLEYSESKEILIGTRGEPLWPQGYIGSISHIKGLAIACVSDSKSYLSIGIDLEEVNRDFPEKIISRICTANELLWCREKDTKFRCLQIFSAKEAIYKALYPLCHKFFGFQAAELKQINENTFKAKLTIDLSLDYKAGFEVSVTSECDGSYILSFVTISSS